MCDGIHDGEVTSKGAKESSIKGKGSATCELLCQGMNEQDFYYHLKAILKK